MNSIQTSIKIAAVLITTGVLACQAPMVAFSEPLVCLATGEKVKQNNGHGNNADGVDSSNPGKSKCGLDTNTAIDDEIKHTAVTTDIATAGGSCITNDGLPGLWSVSLSYHPTNLYAFRQINGQ